MDDTNYCDWGGWLVSARHPIPTAPYDYVWPGGVPTRGCNHLVCGDCGQVVRNRVGYTATRRSRSHLRQLYDADNWAPFVGRDLVGEHNERRFYVCHCDMHVEDFDRAICDRSDWPDDDPGIAWRCAGHPKIASPVDVDGVALDAETDLDALVANVFGGREPPEPPDFTRAHAAAWLVRLYQVLADGPLRQRLARVVADALTAPDPRTRAGAADFFRNLTDAPGAERVVEVLRDRGDLYFGVPNPFEPDETVDGWLQVTLGANLDRPDALAFARQLALGPHEPNVSLVGALIDEDRPFVLAHLEDIVRANPSRDMVRNLLYFLGNEDQAALVEPLIALGRAERVDLDDLLDVVRQLLWSPHCDAVWAAFGRTIDEPGR